MAIVTRFATVHYDPTEYSEYHAMHPKTASLRALGVRQKHYRNRQVFYRVGDVVTDGLGNIVDRPLAERLLCFGDPVEQLWGRFDEPNQWGDREPEPTKCAMCPVAMFCGQVVFERLASSAELLARYHDWEKATAGMSMADRHKHSSWAIFVGLCEKTRWTDANDHMLQAKADEKVRAKLEKAARRSAAARRRKKKPRTVPRRVRIALQKYRDARVEEMRAERDRAGSPLWLRNRTLERCVLIADAFWARELLELSNRKASAGEMRKLLIEENRLVKDGLPTAFDKRINEALTQADKLVDQGDWPFFDPDPAPLRGTPGFAGINPATVHTLIDDDV